MRKILLLLPVFLLLFACNSNSQQNRGGRERMDPEKIADRMVERMNEELSLTEQQQKELKTWFITSFKQREENSKKSKKKREEMREEMKKSREENEAQLKKILTEEQFKQYQENESKRQQERKERGGEHRQGSRGEGRR